jgi:hypothetical protein
VWRVLGVRRRARRRRGPTGGADRADPDVADPDLTVALHFGCVGDDRTSDDNDIAHNADVADVADLADLADLMVRRRRRADRSPCRGTGAVVGLLAHAPGTDDRCDVRAGPAA